MISAEGRLKMQIVLAVLGAVDLVLAVLWLVT